MKKILLTLFCASFLFNNNLLSGIVFIKKPQNQYYCINTDEDKYNQAIQEANKKNKLIFLYFSTPTCSWCNKMKNETLNNNEVKNALKNYIFIEINADQNPKLVKKYSVRAFPTYFIINKEEKQTKSSMGYKNTSDFLSWIK